MKGGFSRFNLSLISQLPPLWLSGDLMSRSWCHIVGDVKRLKFCLLSYPTGSLISLTGSSCEVNEESRLLIGRLFLFYFRS